MLKLFPDQADLIDRVRECLRTLRNEGRRQSVLMVAPTGAGKTVMFSYIAKRSIERAQRIDLIDTSGRRYRVGIFVHREELIEQVSRTLGKFDVPHAVIGAGRGIDLRHTVFVVSVATYAKRIPQVPQFDLIIVDEAHHAVHGSTWAKALAHSPDAVILGVTATPERLGGEGLDSTFEEMVLGPTTGQLIDLGRLSRYRYFGPTRVNVGGGMVGGDYKRGEASAATDKPVITGSAIEHYRKHLDGAPAVAFCVSIEHAQHVAQEFRDAGIVSASIDGKMDRDTRRRTLQDFERGALSVLTSCDLISEGFDCPGIHGAILLRPTQSLALNLQQVGRALRVAPGKECAVILDHVGNWERHGFPDDERNWSLQGRKGRAKDDEPKVSNRQCPKCYGCSPSFMPKCRECGHVFPVEARVVDVVAGTLGEIDPSMQRYRSRDLDDAARATAAKRQSTLEETCIRKMRERVEARGDVFTDDDRQRAIRQAGHMRDSFRGKRRSA